MTMTALAVRLRGRIPETTQCLARGRRHIFSALLNDTNSFAASRIASGSTLLRPRKKTPGRFTSVALPASRHGGSMFFRSGRMRFPPGSRVDRPDGGREFDRVELDLARDRHARAAMEAYADSCAAELPWLSEALRLSRFVAAERLTQCSATVLRVFVMAQSRAAVQPDYAHAAWEHVRSHLTALLAGSPSTAGGAGKPGSNDGKFDYHE
ncbi:MULTISPECIES: hypothetical protein [unclassified Paraburkholderia]|uniref:hypothetical protein n=2 Tax=Paraburkholderia TaxID=1822464 RepID=UPI002AB7E9DF|nr:MULTISPECIES: hypothetical protein [unclassified Paraburkholderia]